MIAADFCPMLSHFPQGKQGPGKFHAILHVGRPMAAAWLGMQMHRLNSLVGSSQEKRGKSPKIVRVKEQLLFLLTHLLE